MVIFLYFLSLRSFQLCEYFELSENAFEIILIVLFENYRDAELGISAEENYSLRRVGA